MIRLSLITLIIALAIPFAMWAQCGGCKAPGSEAGCPTTTDASYASSKSIQLAEYNKPNMIDNTHYFTYRFAKKPKMGMATLIVKVYGKDKKINKDFEVYAVSDMPSMRGAHASGDVKLKANKKGELLVPINFVMPGTWQVDLKFHKAGKKAFEGYFTLKI